MKKLLLGSTLAVFTTMTLAVGFASAQGENREQRNQRPQVTFEMLDTDGSGGITMAEMTAKAAEKFSEADANGDGFVGADEILAGMAEHRGERRQNADIPAEHAERAEQRAEQRAEVAALRIQHMIERQDVDGDGMLSLEEMTPDNADERFERLDTDGNGEISEAEFEAAKKMRGGHRNGKKGQHGDRDDG